MLLAKAVGLQVFDETDPEKVSFLIHRLAREEYKVIFLTEPLFTACQEAVNQYKSETFPAIIPIPDSHGASGVAMANIKANVEKAIGADILFAEEK
ncbi:V-type sodium ATPase subunit G [bioreactor metagenome]|uniref:V-type sodium ATPase subunit G n=1 Tax=bioreactor metagenome TaxID=1076179 RepID=A0A645D967_9ZZZZ